MYDFLDAIDPPEGFSAHLAACEVEHGPVTDDERALVLGLAKHLWSRDRYIKVRSSLYDTKRAIEAVDPESPRLTGIAESIARFQAEVEAAKKAASGARADLRRIRNQQA